MCPTTFAISLPTFGELPAPFATVPWLKEDGSNWATFTPCLQEAMKAISQWGYFDRTTTRPILKDTAQPTTAESEAIKEWECKDIIAGCLLSFRLPT
jgi:hypothetical protein